MALSAAIVSETLQTSMNQKHTRGWGRALWFCKNKDCGTDMPRGHSWQNFSLLILRFLLLCMAYAWALVVRFRRDVAVLSPKGPKLKKYNLDWNVQSRLKNSLSTFRTPHKNSTLVGGSLEIFIRSWNFQSWRAILTFFNIWGLRVSLYLSLSLSLAGP